MRRRWAALVLLLAAGGSAAAARAEPESADRDCTYWPRGGDMESFPHCARLDRSGNLRIAPEHLRRLIYDRHGLATILIGQWYVVRRDGALAPVMIMDNGPEPFSNGLARSPVGGKIGYIDRSLKLVIPARYDGAYPFAHGVAQVCLGCTIQSDGEHSWYAGGTSACIDRRGRTLTPSSRRKGC